MELTITGTELYLFAWAFIASGAAIYQQSRAHHYHDQFRTLMKLACVITKDPTIRQEFERNVVDKLMGGDKEVTIQHFKE